jgi:hypothetical protein
LLFQHELTKTNLGGHILAPGVPLPVPGIIVADIAGGIGTWLLDLADLVPDIIAERLEIDLDNTQPKILLPAGVSFVPTYILRDVSYWSDLQQDAI